MNALSAGSSASIRAQRGLDDLARARLAAADERGDLHGGSEREIVHVGPDSYLLASPPLMRALVKAHAEPGLWLQDVPEPEIGINDVLIRVDRTGICGTDLHIYNWDAWAQKTIPVGLVIGHEFVGDVVAVGDNVTDFAPGDLVSGEGHLVCGRCRNCMAGPAPPVRTHRGHRREPDRRVRRVHRAADDQRLASRHRTSTATSRRSSTRSATPSTPRWRSRCWARTC